MNWKQKALKSIIDLKQVECFSSSCGNRHDGIRQQFLVVVTASEKQYCSEECAAWGEAEEVLSKVGENEITPT